MEISLSLSHSSNPGRVIEGIFLTLSQIKTATIGMIAVKSAAKPDRMGTTEGVFHQTFP